ncbi:MAG: efflux RND transporter permease subunit, partial [Leptolyngbyaceae cyanobacterium]
MNISAWSIRNPIPTIVLFLILTLAGWLGFTRLEIDDTPNIDIAAVNVTVTRQGAGPAELESQVTKIIEDAVASIDNVDTISSTVNDGISSTVINFDLGTDSDRATNDVRNAIDQIRQDLPGDINDPTVRRLSFSGAPVVTYAVRSETRSVENLSDLVDRVIGRELLSVSGVAQIDRIGGVDREIRVNLRPERLQALGITATEVNNQIRNFNINLPGGRIDLSSGESNIRTLGSAPTVTTLGQYEIVLPQGGSIPLNSIGDVVDGFGDLRNLAQFNNEPVVAFSVLRGTGSSVVQVEEGVKAKVAQLEQTVLPEDVSLELIVTRANDVRDSYRATIDTLLIGAILTVITVGCFLRDWRPTLITAMTLPLSIIPTFAVMQWFNYTLNGMTLLALALAVGVLVDDAIVEIENIQSHIDMGKPPKQAALDASAEIGLAVVATTATIVAVFIPVAFMGGIPGQFFQPFGVVVSVSVMFSTLVARTMTNVMGAYLLKPSKNASGKAESPSHALRHSRVGKRFPIYRWVLHWCLSHRVFTLLLAIAFFFSTLQLVPFIPKGLFSSGDTGLSTVQVELPPGSTLDETEGISQRLTNLLLDHPATTSVLTTVGQAGGSRGRSNSSVNTARLYVNLKPKNERTLSQQEFEAALRQTFQTIPGARISFQSQGAGGSNKDLTVVLQSENAEALLQAANNLEQQMREVTGLVDVSSSASLVKPEIVINPDPDRAADLGVSVGAIARTASLATLGDIEANLAKFDLPDRQIPIRVQIDPAERTDLDTLKNLRIPSQTGALVPLTAVADITLGSGPAQIDRFNRSRQVSLEANLEGISLGGAFAAVNTLPAMQNLPPGVEQQPSGDAEIMQEVFTRFGTALGTAVLCIYAILVLLYNGFLHPLTIMVALPLSIGGALIGLLVGQKELGLFALIGIVLLMG